MCSKQASSNNGNEVDCGCHVMSCISVLQRAIHISRSIVLLIMQFSREWVVAAWEGSECIGGRKRVLEHSNDDGDDD